MSIQASISTIATQLQRRAADPQTSVWVAASAGTGKTKVLTDRILNLLLAGAKPAKILALTFTKAAAAEMANRVSDTLSDWAIIDDISLHQKLEKLLGQAATSEQLVTARQLFARVLEAPGGMRIQTIHAFCQSLLGRFPIEAGVAPNFELLDDLGAEILMRQARESVLVQGFTYPNSAIAAHLKILSRHLAEDNFIKIIQGLLSERGRLRRLFSHYGDVEGWITSTRTKFGVDGEDSLEALNTWFCDEQNYDAQALKELAIAADLVAGSTNQNTAKGLQVWLTASPKDKLKLIDDYLLVWLTQKMVERKTIVTKPVLKQTPHLQDVIDLELARSLRYVARRNAIGLFEANAALMRLVDQMLARYQTTKAANAKLDFDDLILKTRHLLEVSETSAQWVLFKLDEGLSHILVDEAQDTNADQWQVILLLAQEFFAGLGQEEEQARTIFVVGDRKQSIYSFQRADPHVFDKMRGLIRGMVENASAKWDEVPLNISFRSTSAILDLTDRTLESDGQRQGLMAPDEPAWRPHQAARSVEKGRVVLWPLVEKTPIEKTPVEKTPVEKISVDSDTLPPIVQPALTLSQQIAKRIKVWTQDGGDKSQAAVRPGDILILLQSRQPLADLLVKALQDQNVPVAGLDRVRLTNQLAVQDLLMLGDFALFPDDDLALACVLRSPLCNFSDQDLYDVSIDRGGASIWSALRDRTLSANSLKFEHALDFLNKVLSIAERRPAFEFYAAVLSEFKQKPKMVARLGDQISDPVQEFLNRALSFETEGPSSLQGFLHWMRKTDLDIKRDAEATREDGAGAVRIMTVHGAKGLQAPVVILPDTTRAKVYQTNTTPMWQPETGFTSSGDKHPDTCWWLPRKDMANDHLQAIKDDLQNNDLEERRRLLYVALTRAENNLHIMGHFAQKELKDTCWYSQISEGFATLDVEFVDVNGQEIQIYETGEQEIEVASIENNIQEDAQAAPDFLFRFPMDEPIPTKPLVPSRPDEDLPAGEAAELVTPPLVRVTNKDDAAKRRFQRGLVTHALLQHLPEVSAEDRTGLMHSYLGAQRPQLDPTTQDSIINEVQAVFDHPKAGVLFGATSQAEVPLVGTVGDRGVSGRVDRLVVLPEEVLVIDFKSNRPPPQHAKAVPQVYVRQMDYYAALLAKLYPERKITRFLLWTDGCHLMEI